MDWFVRVWIPIAIAVTGMAAVSLGTLQYTNLESLHDSQAQIAEEFASSLEDGARPSVLIATTTKLDIASSVRSYAAIYDKNFVPLAWSGELNRMPPALPREVFERAKAAGGSAGERITWVSEQGIRSSIVVHHIAKTDGYVLAGRNMRETDARIWELQVFISAGWLATLLLTLFAAWIGARIAAGKTGVVW